MQRSFENGFCLFQFVKIPWCHKREMLLEKRNAILLQDIRHKRRTGIMILLIKRYLKQDERQSDNTVVISLSLFIALQKLSCNTFFLFCVHCIRTTLYFACGNTASISSVFSFSKPAISGTAGFLLPTL